MAAIAVKGCIIVGEIPSQLGLLALYKKKCEKCSWEEPAASAGLIDPKAKEYLIGFSCPKCKNLQDVIIREA